MLLTAAQKESYMQNDAGLCPYCKSTHLMQRGDLDYFSEGKARQLVECHDCGQGWYDVFTLVDVEDAL